MGSGADWRAGWLQLGPGSGAGKAGAGGIGHRHGSPYAVAAVRKPANAGRTPGVSMGERGCQAPVHCTLPKLLCPILCRVGGARWRLSGHTVLAPSTGGEAAHLLLSGGSSSGGSAASCSPARQSERTPLACRPLFLNRVRALRACRKERAHEIENGSCLLAHLRRGGRGGVRRAAAARAGAGAARGGAGEGAGAGEGERAPHCTPPEPRGSAARSPRFSLFRSASSSRRKRRRGRARRRTRRASRSTG